MRKKTKAGNVRKAKRLGSRGASRKTRKSSAGDKSDSGFGSGTKPKAKDAPQAEPSADKSDGPASGASRSVDRRALRRILTWLLETNTEQQSLILSAMDIVSEPREGPAQPTERNMSPGALLRAILAERTAAILHPPQPSPDKAEE